MTMDPTDPQGRNVGVEMASGYRWTGIRTDPGGTYTGAKWSHRQAVSIRYPTVYDIGTQYVSRPQQPT